MMRKVAAFIKLNFSDPISKAILCENTDLAGISRSVIKESKVVTINNHIRSARIKKEFARAMANNA